MKTIDIIFEKLNEKGIKQQKLADTLGITKSVVSSWKKRNTNPPVEYIVQICELIDTTPNELLGYKHNNDIEYIYSQLDTRDKEIVDLIFEKYKNTKKSSDFKTG